MLSLQLGNLLVVLAAEKGYSESHAGFSKHLTDSDVYYFGSLFSFLKQVTWPLLISDSAQKVENWNMGKQP